MRDILATGDIKTDRTGTGTISKFGGMMKFSLQHGHWPIPTTREVDHKKISEELEWMIKGIIDVQWLKDRNNNIWNSWVGADGSIGPMYGEQWRNWNAGVGKELSEQDVSRLEEMMGDASYWSEESKVLGQSTAIEIFKKFVAEKAARYQDGGRGGVDQLQYVIDELKNNPDSRRICVSLWHAGLLPENGLTPAENVDRGKMALAPCHSMWQVNTAPMSDLEILRYTLEDDETFVAKLNDAHRFGWDTPKLEAQLIPEMNQMLIARGLVVQRRTHETDTNEELQILQTFRSTVELELTEAGADLVASVRELGFRNGRQARKLSLACYARSQDVPLGTVFNVGMYSLMAHILAELTQMVPWEYTHFMGDYHIYRNQVPFVQKQLTREPKRPARVIVDPTIRMIEDFRSEHLQVWYESHDKIVYPRAAV